MLCPGLGLVEIHGRVRNRGPPNSPDLLENVSAHPALMQTLPTAPAETNSGQPAGEGS